MENALGYGIDKIIDVAQLIYSNLKPVSNKYDRTEMEFNELRILDRQKTRRAHLNILLLDRDEPEVIALSQGDIAHLTSDRQFWGRTIL